MERGHPDLSVRRQCELLGVNRAGLYYEPVGDSEENLLLMRLLDDQYTRAPFYGTWRMTAWLATQGHEVNRKRISRLMQVMGVEALGGRPDPASWGHQESGQSNTRSGVPLAAAFQVRKQTSLYLGTLVE